MQQDLPADQFAANMYSIYRMQLDMKLYTTPEEKADLERELQGYEDYYLQVQDENILRELISPVPPTGGHPPPPVI